MPRLARQSHTALQQYGGDKLPAKGVAPGLGLVYGDTSEPPAQQRHAVSSSFFDKVKNWLKAGQYISRGLKAVGAHGLAHRARQHGFGKKKKSVRLPAKRKPKIRALLI